MWSICFCFQTKKKTRKANLKRKGPILLFANSVIHVSFVAYIRLGSIYAQCLGQIERWTDRKGKQSVKNQNKSSPMVACLLGPHEKVFFEEIKINGNYINAKNFHFTIVSILMTVRLR